MEMVFDRLVLGAVHKPYWASSTTYSSWAVARGAAHPDAAKRQHSVQRRHALGCRSVSMHLTQKCRTPLAFFLKKRRDGKWGSSTAAIALAAAGH